MLKEKIKRHLFGNTCRILITIFNSINLIACGICIFYTFQIKTNSEVAGQISSEFIDNFESGYYLNFFKCTSNENQIIFDRWQGTIKGCGFTKNNIKQVRVPKKDENCNEDEVTLEKIPPQPITIFQGLSVCGKTKRKYYELLFSDSVVEENEECPNGYKNCGYIDTVKNKLCLKNDDQCPVSYIKITDINQQPPDGVTNLKNLTSDKIKFFFFK